MIEILNITKTYDDHPAVRDLTLTIRENEVFGMVGTNGAGKTTLMRMMAGILKPDSGDIKVDGEKVYDEPAVKEKIFFIPDEQFYFSNATPEDMKDYYKRMYPNFSEERFYKLLESFGLDKKRHIATFSKGMKKQTALVLGVSSGCKYLYCDETFDGLDPVMRQAAKSLFAKEMADRGMTPILSSHNLRELEDICDHVGLLHQGGILLSRDLNEMKLNIQKLQVVFDSEEERERVEGQLDIVLKKEQGRLFIYTVRAAEAELEIILKNSKTVFFEILPLTLEEIFISETEVVGYDIRKIILG